MTIYDDGFTFSYRLPALLALQADNEIWDFCLRAWMQAPEQRGDGHPFIDFIPMVV
jgi:hypothetical protein